MTYIAVAVAVIFPMYNTCIHTPRSQQFTTSLMLLLVLSLNAQKNNKSNYELYLLW